MVAPEREGFENGDRPEGSGRQDRPDSSEESREIDGSASLGIRIAGGLTERLRGVLRDESDADLLLDRREVEIEIMQWLRALDLHVLGACRADERLKPLLKLNASSGAAEDMLLAQLSQHFEGSEVGLLARCLCVPLVSVRVGKVNKEGNLLCPSATRGHLNLTLLPSSTMRISFTGDDGRIDRLATLSRNSESSEVAVEEITADGSGRSFLIRLPGCKTMYFWSSEKSQLHGLGLLAKMKDLLRRKPTLSNLTGISESRLASFASHLHVHLLGSSMLEADPIDPADEFSSSVLMTGSDVHSPSSVLRSSQSHYRASHASKAQPSHQDSLSPRPNTFKEGITRSSSSIRSGTREKLRRRGDNNNATLSINTQLTTSGATMGQCEDNSGHNNDGFILLPQPETPCVSSALPSSIPSLLNLPTPHIGALKPMFSPYYCWCPPCPSSLSYSANAAHPSLSTTNGKSVPLPLVSPLYSSGHISPLATSDATADFLQLPALNLPRVLPEPIVRLPLPVSSLVTLSMSQQISSYPPYMSDPIVHTPVIDVCSSGQGYLVSAGPAISSAVPPLMPSFVNHPLIPNTESAVEKSARETWRMLMASTSDACSKTLNIFPPILAKSNDNFSGRLGNDLVHRRGILDFQAAAMGVSSISLSSSGDKVVGSGAERVEQDFRNGVDDLTLNSPNFRGCDSTDDGLLD